MLSIIISGLVAVLIAVFLFRYLTIKKHGIYSQRAIGVIHWPKCILHCIALWLNQYLRPKRLNNCNRQGFSYGYCGIVPTPSEVQLERPKNLITDRHDDGIFIWGGDSHGRTIVAKVVRLSRNRACVTLLVKTPDGTIFTLPNQPDSNVHNVNNDYTWQGSGLLIECVEPMRTWRVKFNGFLRKGTRDNYITNDDEDDDHLDFKRKPEDRRIIEARLDFLWKATRAPIDIWHDSSVCLLANALAREPGADSKTYEALERDGYDQWGALHGTAQFGVQPSETWYLRGNRQHRWGMSDSATNLHRSVNFFMHFKNGNNAWLEAFSYKSLISHGVFGYVQTAAGLYLPISSTDVELADLGEDGHVPKNICLEFKAGGNKYLCWLQLTEGVKVHSGDPWTLAHDYNPAVSVSTNLGEGWGLTIFSKRFTALCPVPEKQSLSIEKCAETPPEGEFVLPFSDINCSYDPLAGGKGASLSCLNKIKNLSRDATLTFHVPEGVVVTTDAWEKQVQQSVDLRGCISSLSKAVTSSQMNQIKEACARIQNFLTDFEVCETIVECLHEELQEFFGSQLKNVRFAVRSSARGEDSKEASSAGQNATFLGCYWEGPGMTVTKAIVSCWASQFTHQSIEYKRQRGQPLNDGMAVVVQQMISPTAAGVLFTRDPVTGSPGTVLISANFGLGESVVSGTSDSDTIKVQRTWRNKLEIESKCAGEKKTKFIMQDSGGTKEVEVEAHDRSHVCLSDEIILKLVNVAIFIEECFGSPRDIEFAIYKNELYLLQARPITSLYSWTDYELIHEMDSPFITDKEITTLANTGEVLPGYISPLSLSTIVKCLDLGIQNEYTKREWPYYKLDSSYMRTISIFSSNCFLNFGELALRGNEKSISMVNKAVDLAIFGRLVTTPEILQWGISRFGVMNLFAKSIRTGSSFYDMLVNSRRVKNCRQTFVNFEIDTSRTTSSDYLYKEICRKLPSTVQICEAHSQASGSSTMAQCIALVTMSENDNDVSQKMIQDIAALLCCISETESADVPASLKMVAKTIAASEEVDDFLSMNAEEGRVWLESHPGIVGDSFRDFIFKHGHRCIKEFDLRTLSWGMTPESLVKSLQSMVKTPGTFDSPKKKLDVSQVLDGLENKLTPSKKRALKFIINICGTAVTLREATKSMLIKTLDAFRKAYRTLGQLMVSENRLPSADLIFFLQHHEIGILLETRSASLVTKAINRKRLMLTVEKLKFEEIHIGIPKPIVLKEQIDIILDTSKSLRGTPVCHGICRGTAKVITCLDDADTIKNGDILITYSTDVGWTLYFPLLSGVVTEIGGLISHGAVVAREYGLPCVVGVKGATTIFKSGDILNLNGKEGTIQLVTQLVAT